MFGAYDVRGIYGKDVTDAKFSALGSALSSFSASLVLGMDYREHNSQLAKAFLSGYSGGVRYAGFAPTPLVVFNSGKLGACITASHNPPEYAGIKFSKEKRCFYSEELAVLKKKFEAAKQKRRTPVELPKVDEELVSIYLDSLPVASPNALFDLAGGSACALKNYFPQSIFSKPDPRFEKHAGEPTREALSVLTARTREKQCVGIAFDGDADRAAVVDCGEFVDGGIAGAFLAVSNLKRRDKVVLTIDVSDEVFLYLQDYGLQPIYSPVGDVFLLKKAISSNAAFGFERSSHYSFLNHMPHSDGIYAGALLSKVKPGEIRDFAKQFKVVTLIESVPTQKLGASIPRDLLSNAPLRIEVFDGLKARFDDFSILVRASQTEPKIRINVEAKTTELASQGMRLAKEQLAKSKL
jgi:phosphomannomutase